MIHYTCDVCGGDLPAGYSRPEIPRKLTQLCGVEDVCPDCVKVGETINAAAVLLEAWKLNLHQAEPQGREVLREYDNPPSLSQFSGRSGTEKRKILARLKAYRESNGLGCLAVVAKLAGPTVSDGLLRDMLIGAASPPINDWRRIGKALEKLEGGGGGNGG